LTACDDR